MAEILGGAGMVLSLLAALLLFAGLSDRGFLVLTISGLLLVLAGIANEARRRRRRP